MLKSSLSHRPNLRFSGSRRASPETWKLLACWARVPGLSSTQTVSHSFIVSLASADDMAELLLGESKLEQHLKEKPLRQGASPRGPRPQLTEVRKHLTAALDRGNLKVRCAPGTIISRGQCAGQGMFGAYMYRVGTVLFSRYTPCMISVPTLGWPACGAPSLVGVSDESLQ